MSRLRAELGAIAATTSVGIARVVVAVEMAQKMAVMRETLTWTEMTVA